MNIKVQKSYPYLENLVYMILEDCNGEIDTEKFEIISNNMNKDTLDGVEYALSLLTEREQKVITDRFKNLKTLSVIGNELGIRRERVRQIEAKVLRKLRHPNRFRYIFYGYKKYTEMIESQAKNTEYLKAQYKTKQVDLNELSLSVRSYNALRRAGYNTLNDIKNLSVFDLLHMPNIGEKSAKEIITVISEYSSV